MKDITFTPNKSNKKKQDILKCEQLLSGGKYDNNSISSNNDPYNNTKKNKRDILLFDATFSNKINNADCDSPSNDKNDKDGKKRK